MIGQIEVGAPCLTANEAGKLLIAFEVAKGSERSARELYGTCKAINGTLTLTVDKPKRKRSLDANGYCWVLCQRIAEALGTTKEDVYKHHIRDVGKFEVLTIAEEDYEGIARLWAMHGLGWFLQKTDVTPVEGLVTAIAYVGSSVYDTKEMSVLVDSIVEACKELAIPTETAAEIALLKESWHGKK